jgi:hypothetical protein
MRYPGGSVRDALTVLAFGCCQVVPRRHGHGAAHRGGMTALLLWGNQMVLAALSGAAILPGPSKTCRGGR